MTRSNNGYENDRVTRLQSLLVRLAPLLFLVVVALVVVGLRSGHRPRRAARPRRRPSPPRRRWRPAPSGANPWDLLAWAFTPIFQSLFIVLVLLDTLVGHNIAVAIILLTIIIKLLMTPLTKKQVVSAKRTQMLQPEIKEIQRKYKGDRVKSQAATQEFYKQRGINPAGGCLPIPAPDAPPDPDVLGDQPGPHQLRHHARCCRVRADRLRRPGIK